MDVLTILTLEVLGLFTYLHTETVSEIPNLAFEILSFTNAIPFLKASLHLYAVVIPFQKTISEGVDALFTE